MIMNNQKKLSVIFGGISESIIGNKMEKIQPQKKDND